jgi:hypothetical protein
LSAKRGVLGGADGRDAQGATVRRFLATDEAKIVGSTFLARRSPRLDAGCRSASKSAFNCVSAPGSNSRKVRPACHFGGSGASAT